MHGAGPRRGFAPDDAPQGQAGGRGSDAFPPRRGKHAHDDIWPWDPTRPARAFSVFPLPSPPSGSVLGSKGCRSLSLGGGPVGLPRPARPPSSGPGGGGEISRRRRLRWPRVLQEDGAEWSLSRSVQPQPRSLALCPRAASSLSEIPRRVALPPESPGPRAPGSAPGGHPTGGGGRAGVRPGTGAGGGRASHPVLTAHGGPAAPGRAHGTAAARPRRPGGPRRAELALSFGDSHRRLWHERWDSSGFWRTWAKSCASRPLTCRRKTAKALSPSERGEVTARGSRLSARGPASGRDQGGGASPRGKDKRDPR